MKKKYQFGLIVILCLGFGFDRAPQSAVDDPGPASTPTPGKVYYTALGDSITFGLWSTKPCNAKIPQNMAISCKDGTAFPDRVAQSLEKDSPTVEQNLGISGARIDDVIAQELPVIQETPTLLTFYIGTNDIYGITNGIDENGHTVSNYTDAMREAAFSAFEAKYRKFASQLKTDYPEAKIVLLNLPAPATDDLAKRLNTEVINPLAQNGFIIIDLASDPESYDPAMYASGPHPNDRGYQHIADKILAALQ